MDTSLPESARWRYRREVDRAAGRSGVFLVVAAALAVMVWTANSAVLDLGALARVPQSLGFTMFSGHPVRAQSGYAPQRSASIASGCDPARPTFALGMARLKEQLADRMGDATECEHPIDGAGNTVQATTAGVAEYLADSQIVTFTDGVRRWELTGDAMRVFFNHQTVGLPR
jgi:hypothetical protein